MLVCLNWKIIKKKCLRPTSGLAAGGGAVSSDTEQVISTFVARPNLCETPTLAKPLPRREIYPFPFLPASELVTKPINPTGNNLETSKPLSFTPFCTNYKERIFDDKAIPHIKLGGKILYRSSDIEKLLEDGYRDKFR